MIGVDCLGDIVMVSVLAVRRSEVHTLLDISDPLRRRLDTGQGPLGL